MKYIIAPIATALFLLSGCDNAQTSAPQQPTPEVGVVTLQSQPVPVVSQLTGRTTASLSAEVRPQVGGIIQKRLFTEGDMVKAGQALYQIDPSSYRATWNEAAAALKQAQALVVSDCQKAQRYASLVRDNGVSRQDADDAASTCAQDKASVESKKMIVGCLIRRVDVYRGYRVHIDFNIDFKQFSLGLDIAEIAA